MDQKSLPLITVITPSFNQCKFIEDTIKSVLGQGYPNLRYIVIDGGSTDGSQEIIQRYTDRLYYWCSEVDNGQVHAINKGIKTADQDHGIICYINSDDLLLPGSLAKVANIFTQSEFFWAAGSVALGSSLSQYNVWAPSCLNLANYIAQISTPQPGVFISAKAFANLNLPCFNENNKFNFDHELFIRLYLAYGPPQLIKCEDPIAFMRMHDNQRTVREHSLHMEEKEALINDYLSGREGSDLAELLRKEIKRESTKKLLLDAQGDFSFARLCHALYSALTCPYVLRDRVVLGLTRQYLSGYLGLLRSNNADS